MVKLKHASQFGKMMILIGSIVLVPIVVLPFYEETEFAFSFFFPSFFSILLGIICCFLGREEEIFQGNRVDIVKQSTSVVFFSWIWGILIGAAPFVLAGELTFVQAIFESVSGFTTTGLSVVDVTKSPYIFLFHRSFMQYCGGLGFVVVIAMITINKQSMELYQAEGHPDRLYPTLKKTVQAIFWMYNSFLVLGTFLYLLFGMSFFDSITHAMSSLSTGGFSTRLNSIGEYNSFGIEVVTIFLMLIGTTNFGILLLLVKKKWKEVFSMSEVRFLGILLVLFVPIMAFSLAYQMNVGLIEGLRLSLFNVSSALSTTGYSTMSYSDWPPFAIGIMILMMIIGGGIGSTAGGLKLLRVYLLCKATIDYVKLQFTSKRKIRVSFYRKAQGKFKIDTILILETMGFFMSYLVIFLIGSLLLTLTAGVSLTDAMFEFASSLGTVGLSIGFTSGATNDATLIVEILGMIIGRLEIFAFFIGFFSCIEWIKNKFRKGKI